MTLTAPNPPSLPLIPHIHASLDQKAESPAEVDFKNPGARLYPSKFYLQ
jgi:hypothetical protein